MVKSRSASRIQDRLIDELIGICRGVIADGRVDEQEAIFLGQWIESHREIADKWPVNVLYARLTEMLRDGVLSRDEQGDLLDTLKALTGDNGMLSNDDKSTTLPLDVPAPRLEFAGRSFCLTGRFVFGDNLECEEVIVQMGGEVVSSPTRTTDYLVIGELCSPDWAHTTFGRSIEKAIELRADGAGIAIVSEEHWVDALSG
ncbi:MAG: BRCT domain-containing protein [Pseudomonadota bacterium]